MKRILIFLLTIVVFTACNKEEKNMLLPPTTDVKCYFGNNEEPCGISHNIWSYVEGIPEGVKGLKITTKLSDFPDAPEVINNVELRKDPYGAYDHIVLRGVYVGNNDIKVEVISNNIIMQNRIIYSDADGNIDWPILVPLYNLNTDGYKEMHNVYISEFDILNLGTFKPYNAVAKLIFDREISKYHHNYRLHYLENNTTIGLYGKRNDSYFYTTTIFMADKFTGPDTTKVGVTINDNSGYTKIRIDCQDYLGNDLGSKIIDLVPGKCIVKTFKLDDFIEKTE